MLKEFRAFLLRGNILELAIAVIMGTAFGLLIKSLIDNIINPILAAIVGKPNFDDVTLDIGKAHVMIGAFLTDVISFVSVALAVFFFIVKPASVLLARRARGEGDDDPAPPSEDIVLLGEIRDLLKARP